MTGFAGAEAHWQALVTLTGGILAILVVVGGLIWRVGAAIQRQVDATKANTEALQGTDDAPGLIDTVADMRHALDELRAQLSDDAVTRSSAPKRASSGRRSGRAGSPGRKT